MMSPITYMNNVQNLCKNRLKRMLNMTENSFLLAKEKKISIHIFLMGKMLSMTENSFLLAKEKKRCN